MYDERYMGKKPGQGFPDQKNQIVNILISRDGMTPNEAWTYFETCQNEFDPTCDDPEEALADYFGLEPDYIFDFLE